MNTQGAVQSQLEILVRDQIQEALNEGLKSKLLRLFSKEIEKSNKKIEKMILTALHDEQQRQLEHRVEEILHTIIA